MDKKYKFKKEFNHYVVLSVPTRFVRDWIVSRYADKILDVIKFLKKALQRIEFLIEETRKTLDQSKFFQKKTSYFNRKFFIKL